MRGVKLERTTSRGRRTTLLDIGDRKTPGSISTLTVHIAGEDKVVGDHVKEGADTQIVPNFGSEDMLIANRIVSSVEAIFSDELPRNVVDER